MVHATSLKRFCAVSAAIGLFGLVAIEARGQDLVRVNQDELASFYGRMNVVVGSGARAFGMGGAFLARADDATAASWNPAGLSYLRRKEFSLVGVHNDFSQRIPRANTAVDPPDINITTVDQLRASVADFMGFAYPLRIGERNGAIQLSYQRSFSFSGSRRSQGPVGVKGFAPSPATVLPTEFTVEGRGGFDTVSLSSGFEVHPKLRLGLSVNRWLNGFSQVVNRPNAQNGGYRRIESAWDISGTNVNLGALIAPTTRLNLGVVYKTAFAANVQLRKVREDLLFAVDNQTGEKIEPEFVSHAAAAEIRFPRVYGFGASYQASNTLTFSADFTRTAWSQATITDFFSLAREVQPKDGEPPANPIDTYTKLPFPAVEEGGNGQSDTSQLRLGAEWVLRLGESGNVLLPLRVGFFRDGQPVTIRLKAVTGFPLTKYQEQRPTFTGLTMGLGVTVGGVIFDLAYIRESGDVPASRLQDGFFDSQREIRYSRVFASMIVRFGQRR
jgi:hypothetical protein